MRQNHSTVKNHKILLFKLWILTKNYVIFICGVTLTHYNYYNILVLITQQINVRVSKTCWWSSSSTGTIYYCGLWPVEQDPSIFSYLSPTLSIIVKSIQFLCSTCDFYCVGLLAPRQTPNLEDQGIPFVLVITLDLSGMGGPTSSICYCQHSSWDHVITQAPPLRQSRDTFGWMLVIT
jgi:hypothetical protein